VRLSKLLQAERGVPVTAIKECWVEVDDQGRLVLPPEVTEQYGIQPGAQILLKEGSNGLHLHRPITHLAKVYVEPTNRCNLTCRTCIRNAWEEPQGDMTTGTFDRLVANLKELPSQPDIFFGGFGEPLLLQDIAERVAQVRLVAGKVELITNGVLLTEECGRELIKAGLNRLWVSLDGVTPESYADVRLGAELPNIFKNIHIFNRIRNESPGGPELGISFVAMRRNIADLPALIRMSSKLGVSRYNVTNVFPYTEEMRGEMLYARSVDGVDSIPSMWQPLIDLPRLDFDDASQGAIIKAIRNRHNISLNNVPLGQERGHCPFIERGSVSIAWTGEVSPCLALMHGYETFLNSQRRKVRRCVLGNLHDQDLLSAWETPEYVAFRKRVQEFDFAPCTWCGGCEMAEANEEDCFANPFPTCGGCLWAQGVIQCP
jgi:MoaA/NifB/PqqE/SkfB family radical SAM enzyme